MLVFFAGLLYWGNKFKALRRTTIIFIGIGGGLLMLAAIFALNHSLAWGIPLQILMALGACAGLFILAGATPAALGLLADMSEAHPTDRGAIMGLYSVFLAIGQITGALVGGAAADWRGIDGILAASLGLLVIALLPIHRLRSSEHLLDPGTQKHRRPRLRRALRSDGLDWTARAPGTGAARSPAARISDPCASRSSSSPPCATIPPTRRWRRIGSWSAPATSGSWEPGSIRSCRWAGR